MHNAFRLVLMQQQDPKQPEVWVASLSHNLSPYGSPSVSLVDLRKGYAIASLAGTGMYGQYRIVLLHYYVSQDFICHRVTKDATVDSTMTTAKGAYMEKRLRSTLLSKKG